MPNWLWWALGALAAIVAGLGVVVLGRKRAPRWLTLPLLLGAAILASLGALRSVLDWRDMRPLGEVDCSHARTLSARELDALKVLVLQGRTSPEQLRDFACAFADRLSLDDVPPPDRILVIEATAAAAGSRQYQRRSALLELERATTSTQALEGLLGLTDAPSLRESLQGAIIRAQIRQPRASETRPFIVVTSGGAVLRDGEALTLIPPDVVQRAYPARARAERLGGVVELDCDDTPKGYFSCLPISETPDGYGFAESARDLLAELSRSYVFYTPDMIVEYRFDSNDERE